MATTVKVEGKKLVITMDLQEPTPSSSGKTLIVASTHGNVPTEAKVNGKTLVVGVTAYVKP